MGWVCGLVVASVGPSLRSKDHIGTRTQSKNTARSYPSEWYFCLHLSPLPIRSDRHLLRPLHTL